MKNKLPILALACILMLTACAPKPNTGNAAIDAMDAPTLASNLTKALNQITSLRDQLAESTEDVERLTKLVQGVQFTDPEFPAITRVDDDTERLTFNKPGSYLLLPEALVYPGVSVLPNASLISLGGGNTPLVLSPSPVWTYRFEGNRLFLSGEGGIYGEVVVGKNGAGTVDEGMINILFDGHAGQEEQRDEYNRITQIYIPASEGLIATVPADPGKSSYRNDEVIFWSGKFAGRQVSLNTSVNGESAVNPVGLFSVGQLAVLYTFAYDAERDSQNEATLLALLQTMTVQNKSIAVGF